MNYFMLYGEEWIESFVKNSAGKEKLVVEELLVLYKNIHNNLSTVTGT